MKKVFVVLLIMSMSISMLVGCGGSDKDTNKNPNTENDSKPNQDADTDKDESTEEENTSGGTSEDISGNTGIAASDWLVPKIEIDGVVYTFPMEAQELVDNGWTMINKFPIGARPGANAGINFTKGDLTLFTNISSTTGAEQKMEEGEVCSISYAEEYDNFKVPIKFPGGLTIGMSKAEAEKILPGEFEYNEKYHYFQYTSETEKGKLDIKVEMSDDDSTVERIMYTCWTK